MDKRLQRMDKKMDQAQLREQGISKRQIKKQNKAKAVKQAAVGEVYQTVDKSTNLGSPVLLVAAGRLLVAGGGRWLALLTVDGVLRACHVAGPEASKRIPRG